jgi:hypothetical protein
MLKRQNLQLGVQIAEFIRIALQTKELMMEKAE